MKSYSIAMVAACPFPANYGSPASIREMSMTLSRRGHRVHVVTYPYGQELPVEGIRLHRVPDWVWSKRIRVGPSLQKPWLDLLMVFSLLRLVRREKIQLIHTHNYEGALIGIAVKWLTGIPLLYNAVNTMADELPGYRFIRPAFLARWIASWLDRWVPVFPDHITVVSEELRGFLRNQGVPAGKISLVPAGIHPAMFDRSDSRKTRERYSLGDDPVVMYTGTLDPFQRVDYLLRAFAIVSREKRNARLLIVHNVDQPDYVREHRVLAERLGLTDRIQWIGPHSLEELPEFLAAASVAVMPRPDCPGHPVKLLNYMGAGKPIVTFRGSAKGLRHDHDALIVPDHDWENMGQSILALIDDPDRSARLGAQARLTAARQFDWEVLAGKIEILYEGIIDHHGSMDRDRWEKPSARTDSTLARRDHR